MYPKALPNATCLAKTDLCGIVVSDDNQGRMLMKPRNYSYSFLYKHGQSMPEAHLPAEDDDHFFETVLPAWEKDKGFEHVRDSVVCTMSEYRRVPEPKKCAASTYEPEYVGFG